MCGPGRCEEFRQAGVSPLLGEVCRAPEREPCLSIEISKESWRPEALQSPAGLLQDAGTKDVPFNLILSEGKAGKVALDTGGDHAAQSFGGLGMGKGVIDGKAIVAPVDGSTV